MFDPESTLYATGVDRRATPDYDDLASLLRRPEWHAQAACRHHPELDWFPGRGESNDDVKAICRECPVLLECADASTGERHGVWAATSERERRLLRRKLRRTAA